MRKTIGFPEWINDPKQIDADYKDIIEDIEHDQFISSLLSIKRTKFYLTLKPVSKSDSLIYHELWNPLWINAFNFKNENHIYVTLLRIFFPFCDLGLESLNYGSIGSTIGHEIMHGFDTTEANSFICTNNRAEYQQRIKCYTDYYSNWTVYAGNNPEDRILLNSQQTINENIADNEGLRIAFQAYKTQVKEKRAEKLLSALNQYSSEQLFFISFANNFCGYEIEVLLRQMVFTDSHSPRSVRVRASLKNSKEFAETWNCPVGSPMNPIRDRCELW